MFSEANLSPFIGKERHVSLNFKSPDHFANSFMLQWIIRVLDRGLFFWPGEVKQVGIVACCINSSTLIIVW